MAGTTSRSLGMPGVSVEPGAHLCGLYIGQQERDGVVLPSLRAGLRAGDECLGIVDSNGPVSLMIDRGDGIAVRGGLLVELLKTHPKVLLGGLVFEQHLSPDDYRSGES